MLHAPHCYACHHANWFHLNSRPFSSHKPLVLPGVHTCFSLFKPPIIPTLSSLSLHVLYSAKDRSIQKRIPLQVPTIISIHLKASMSMPSLLFCYYRSTICVLFPGQPLSNPVPSRTLKDIVQTLFLLSPTSSMFSSQWIISISINILSNLPS